MQNFNIIEKYEIIFLGEKKEKERYLKYNFEVDVFNFLGSLD